MTSAMYRQEIETTGFYMEFIVKPPKNIWNLYWIEIN